MIFILLTFLAALALAAVSGWFSIVGFMAIYAGAPMYALIMGVVVECAKLVTTSWLYRNSKTASWGLKAPLYYFTIALMAATSIGVFGFLSKAHLEQGAGTIDNAPKIERLNYQIDREKSIIADNEKVIKQLDDTVNSFLGKERTDRSLSVRKSQAPQRKQLREDIDASQKRIDQLSEEKLKLDSEVRKMQLEVGPIRYIAELIYGVQEDAGKNVESAVRMFTLLIVSTLDPLAIALLIAANHSLTLWKRKDETEETRGEPESVEGDLLVEEVLPEEGSSVQGSINTSDPDTSPASEEEEEIIHAPETKEIRNDSVEVQPDDQHREHGALREESGPVALPIQISTDTGLFPIGLAIQVNDHEEAEDFAPEGGPDYSEIREDGIPTVATEVTETIVESLVGPGCAVESTSGMAGEEPDTEIQEEALFIEVMKPSWELDPVPEDIKTPWAQQDAVLRELLGAHFTPTKVNEKEENKSHTEREASVRNQDQSKAEVSWLDDDTSAPAAPWQEEILQVSAEASLQDQDAEVLGELSKRSSSDASSDKYPKALSWLNEFRRD